ncbi:MULTISPECIES: hypothetical protein [unclassified Mesorhizobium]|uniref:hypothetical protein n=1 Tax=unclassified Mesorhizobium TaxID=325217 RepID=UPI0012DFAD5F|nr:hypothetical protein [Mesorhizobium sp. L2C085B000]
MTDKRSRGRPVGSGKQDAPFLAIVADILIRNPSLSPTAAMKQVRDNNKGWEAASDEALLRRWQDKWSKEQGQLIADAKERARPRAVVVHRILASGVSRESPFGAVSRLQETLDAVGRVNDYLKPFREAQALQRQLKDMIDAPSIRAVRDSMGHAAWLSDQIRRLSIASLGKQR